MGTTRAFLRGLGHSLGSSGTRSGEGAMGMGRLTSKPVAATWHQPVLL